MFMRAFWSYLSNREYFDLFHAQGVLWSFSMFGGGGDFSHFLGIEGVLDICFSFLGAFWSLFRFTG